MANDSWIGNAGKVVGTAVAALAAICVPAMRAGRNAGHEAVPILRSLGTKLPAADLKALQVAKPQAAIKGLAPMLVHSEDGLLAKGIPKKIGEVPAAPPKGVVTRIVDVRISGGPSEIRQARGPIAPIALFVPTASARLANLSVSSTTLGYRVMALRVKVPPAPFQALLQRWQNNDEKLSRAKATPVGPETLALIDTLMKELQSEEAEVRQFEKELG